MILDQKHDGLLYSVAWPFRNPADLQNYLNKQKTEIGRAQYPLEGSIMIYVETEERKMKGCFIVRKLKQF